MSSYKTPNMKKPPDSFDNCPDYLDRYLDYIFTFQNRRPSTVIEVCSNLREFFQYIHYCNLIGEKPDTKDAHRDMDITCMKLEELCNVTREDVEGYLCFHDTVCRVSVSTIRKKLVFLRRFYSYLMDNAQELDIDPMFRNPVAKISIPSQNRNLPLILSVQQVQRLADNVAGDFALRDRAIILLLATTGITLSELVSLNWEDLDGDTLAIRSSRKAPREIYLTNDCQTALRRYLDSVQLEGDQNAMFLCSNAPRRLTPKAVQLRIAKAAASAGMSQQKVSAKTLRDFAASALLKRASDKTVKSQILTYLGFTSELSAVRFEEVRHE